MTCVTCKDAGWVGDHDSADPCPECHRPDVWPHVQEAVRAAQIVESALMSGAWPLADLEQLRRDACEIKRLWDELSKELTTQVAERMESQTVDLPGVGRIKRRRRQDRVRWDGQSLIPKLVEWATEGEGRADPVTGEVRDDPLPVVVDTLVSCAGLANGSQSWRVGELRSRGLEPDEFKSSEPGPWQIEAEETL